ncbi:MAG TPA: division/cell wall cluster transcriptional repressor MraZ [Candidatus Eisenbacteria bacterium]
MAFYGTDNYAIDHKGRLSVPATLRRPPGRRQPIQTFFLVAGFEGCLALYAPEDWARVEERMRKLPMGGRKARAFARAFLMHASPVSVDAQGRITIPPALMSRAGLGKEATLHGVGDHIEIWNPERLAAVIQEAQANLETNAEDVLGDREP